MFRKWSPFATLQLSCILIVLAALTTGSLQAQEPPPPYDPQQVPVPARIPVAGLAVDTYSQNCAPCHGVSGDGDGPAGATADPTIFSDPAAVWERSPAELFHFTKFGRIENLMPPWRNSMSDEQIWQAVYYSWNLHTDEAEVDVGAELYTQSCAACHGESGRGVGTGAGADMPDFSSQAEMIFISQAELEQRWRTAHAELAADWSTAQRQAVLEFIRTFTYQPLWTPFSVSGPGVITGRLFQGTENGQAPPQSEVTLNIFQQTELLLARSAVAEADGSFRFENLPVDEGYYFLVETDHRDIRYTSPILAFSGPDFTEDRVSPESIDTLLPVYETTSDPAGLLISRSNWIVEHEPGSLLVGQLFTFGNRGDRTYVGAEEDDLDTPVTLVVPLPVDAREVEIQDGLIGEVYRLRQHILYDTRPVPPGEDTRQIFVRYRVPYTADAAEISFPVPYDASMLNLLVADLPNLAVELTIGDEVQEPAGQETIQGVLFRRWSAPVSSSTPVHVSLSGLISAGGRDPRPDRGTQMNQEMPVSTPPLDARIPIAFGSIVGFVLVAALLLFIHRERTKSPLTAEQMAGRREELIDRIARLDDLHALGELEEKAWLGERTSLKKELIGITLAEQKERAAL